MNARTLKRELKYKIPQFKLALLREREIETFQIRTPDDIQYYAEPLKHMAEENFVAFHLDVKNHIIGYHVVSHGTLTATLVHPREVFKAALLSNANSIIVAHNHPAGSLIPSVEDEETTKVLIAAGKLLGVSVVDHVIVSINGCRSIREYNPEWWSES